MAYKQQTKTPYSTSLPWRSKYGRFLFNYISVILSLLYVYAPFNVGMVKYYYGLIAISFNR